MSVSHSAQYEPTRVDVWTVLKELPHRVRELLKHHESSRELGVEVLEQELHALFTHAECAATSEALEREDVDLPYVFIDGEKHHRVLLFVTLFRWNLTVFDRTIPSTDCLG